MGISYTVSNTLNEAVISSDFCSVIMLASEADIS